MPLTPGQQGEASSDAAIATIMYWQYQTMCRGRSSLIEQIAALGVNPADYIAFFGLRTHATMPSTGVGVTEQIYIHSKVMIVDDRVAIIGSANINDRSMAGTRDSEIAAVFESWDGNA